MAYPDIRSTVQFQEIPNGDTTLRVALKGTGPVILCVHGWPELWYSWRHQIGHFADAGYTVAAFLMAFSTLGRYRRMVAMPSPFS